MTHDFDVPNPTILDAAVEIQTSAHHLGQPFGRPHAVVLSKEGPNHPLFQVACEAGFNLIDCMQLDISPISFETNEAWKPLLMLMCQKFGYKFRWTCIEIEPLHIRNYNPDWTPIGRFTLTKTKANGPNPT